MKTKTQLFYLSFFCLLLICLTGCSSADEGTVEAFIGVNCGGDINHEGDDVYAYNAANIFFTQSIQTGGHTNGSTTDLGVNIFNGNSLVMEGDYQINGGGGQTGTAYVYFQPTRESSYEFISKENQGVLRVLEASYTSDEIPQVASLIVEFDNVEMTNFNTGQDTCVSDFKLNVSL